MNLESHNHQYVNGKIENTGFIFKIVLLDLLFLPYLPILKLSLSMIILPIYFLLNFKKKLFDKDVYPFLLFMILSVISILVSKLAIPEYFVSNIISFGTLVYSYLIYTYIKSRRNLKEDFIKKMLILYILFNFVLATIYFFNAQTYFTIRAFWTLSGDVIIADQGLSINRMTGVLSDPNNLATIINAVYLFLLFNTKKLGGMIGTICLFMVSWIVISTQSTTGLILLGISIISYLYIYVESLKNITSKQFFTATALLVILGLIIITFKDYFIESNLLKSLLYRTENNTVTSRTEIWKQFFENKNLINYILFGDGGHTVINGRYVSSHNGHLHLIYNYGIVAYLCYMYVYFRPRSKSFIKYLFMIPILIGFTINIGIIDFRFLTLFVMLLGIYASNTSTNWIQKI